MTAPALPAANSPVREVPMQFGAGGRLFGICTEPVPRQPQGRVVLIPNTGLEHRVGPNRLHVELARALAAAGHVVLRFDLGGLGDSQPSAGARPDANQDCRDALAALDARGIHGPVLMVGLCSGAHTAHQFAKAEPRIAGLFSIDGYTGATGRFRRLLWQHRLMHPSRSLRRAWGRWREGNYPDAPLGMDADFVPWPPVDDNRRDFTDFLARGLSLAFLFTGDVQGEYLYREQQWQVYPMLAGRAPVWFWPEIDHTLTRRAARERVIALITRWVSDPAAVAQR